MITAQWAQVLVFSGLSYLGARMITKDPEEAKVLWVQMMAQGIKKWVESKQMQCDYVPAPTTDYVFSK